MGSARLGCQTYAWQMSGATYLGRLDHIIDVVGDSGFQGIEAEVQFLGALRDPVRMSGSPCAEQNRARVGVHRRGLAGRKGDRR